jgi:hypothetical protein
MTRDDIICMAHEAGCAVYEGKDIAPALTRFAALVAEAEREACIDDCKAEARDDGTAQRIIERIRARGTK